jgi:hypothetical protein
MASRFGALAARMSGSERCGCGLPMPDGFILVVVSVKYEGRW